MTAVEKPTVTTEPSMEPTGGIPTLSVVIPVFNEADTVGGCLERLTAQGTDITEIIVVDNNSTDGSVDVVAEFADRHPNLRIVTESEQGLVHARNAGLDAASSDLIARIDADTHVSPTWARTIVEFFAADTAQHWSSLCGRGEAYGVPLSGRFDKWKIKLHPLGQREAKTTPSDIPVLYGSNMVLRRTTWQRIRDRVSMRRDIFEDVDMGLCVREDGGRNAFLPSLTVGVSPRRMESGLREFVHYMSFLPRTFALHRHIGYTAGTALIYVPALTVLHTGRLLVIRLYDSETGQFTPNRLWQRASSRVLP